jgi:hypothetical protein
MRKTASQDLRAVLLVGAIVLRTSVIAFGDPSAAPSTAGLPERIFQIVNVAKDQELMADNDSRDDGAGLVLAPGAAWKCMAWRFQPLSNGFRLVNLSTGKTIIPNPTCDEHGITFVRQHTPGRQPAADERWRFVPLGEGMFRIEYVKTGEVLGINNDGSVIVGRWMEADHQKWKMLGKPNKFTG